jgi:limonene 1,2-monooxygenase
VIDRRTWRVMTQWHLAPTREQAIAEVAEGLKRWHNEYNVGILGRPKTAPVEDGAALARHMVARGTAIFGTPDDAVAQIARLQAISGGFGTLIGFAHDWAAPEERRRSYDLFARYVIPRVQGLIDPVQRSADFLTANKAELMDKAGQAVLSAIRAHNATHPRQQKREATDGSVVPTAVARD